MALGVSMIRNVLLLVIFMIILFTVLNDTVADVYVAAGNISAAGGAAANTYPLTSFFKPKGIILLAVIAGVIIVVITGALAIGKGGK